MILHTRRQHLGWFVLGLALALPAGANANLVNEEDGVYIARPLFTEPAWPQTSVYLNSMLFDMPDAVSFPSPQVGLIFTPGFSWSLFDILEINVAFPLALNPDATGDQELHAADLNPALKDSPMWDDHPDLDLPGLIVGLKGTVWGKPGKDKFLAAVGMRMSFPMFGELETNFVLPRTQPNYTSTMRFEPYAAVALGLGKFSPQLQVGATIRLPDEKYNAETGGMEEGKGRVDLFFNLALPFAFVFEGTVPMLEINGVVGPNTTQLYITPAVTFLPRKSPAQLGFACMIPVLDSDLRDLESFRLLVNFSYKFDALTLPAFWGDEGEDSESKPETPPAGW